MSKYVRKKKEMKKKRDGMGFYLVAHLKKANAPPHSLYPSTKAHSLIAAAVSSSSSQRRRSIFRSHPHSRSARRRRRRRSVSGSQRRRGSPRLGSGVSGSPSRRLSPGASRPRLRSSAHRSATLRARLPLPSRLRWTVDGARPRRLRCAPRAMRGRRAAGASSRCSTKAVAKRYPSA